MTTNTFHLQQFRNKDLKPLPPKSPCAGSEGTNSHNVILFIAHNTLRKKWVFFGGGVRIKVFLTYHQPEHIKIHRAVVV